jgi:biopolymer transport protein ExbB
MNFNMEFTFISLSFWKQGGPLTFLLLALIFLGLILFLERLIFLHKSQIKAPNFVSGIKNLVRKHRLLEAITVCEGTPGPVAQIVKVALVHQGDSEYTLRGEVQKAALLQVPLLQKRLGIFSILVHLGPLLGLLGVATSFLQIFLKMKSLGPYTPLGLFFEDMVQALITLSVGIFCAILSYLGHYLLKSRMRLLLYDMEWSASDMVQFLLTFPEEGLVDAFDRKK